MLQYLTILRSINLLQCKMILSGLKPSLKHTFNYFRLAKLPTHTINCRQSGFEIRTFVLQQVQILQ